MDFCIAIPTYNRPEIFKQKTMKLLMKHNIPTDNVLIFMEDEDQKELYGELPYSVILTNSYGIKDTRNFLQRYFYNHNDIKNVIYLDDDIKEIHNYDKPLENLIEFGNKIFEELKEKNLYICGVSPYHNKFYLKKTTTTTLKYICGCFRAEIIRKDKPLILTPISHFEDHLFSCEYFKRDGGVMRKNWIAIETKYFEEIGGINGSMGGMINRQKIMEVNKNYMLEHYKGMVRAVEKKYGWDIRLNHNFKYTSILD
jgi:hypothetical protein